MKRRIPCQPCILLVVTALFAGPSTPQTARAQAAPAMEAANTYYQAQEWNKAAEAYAALAEAHPANGLAWFRWGYALGQVGRYREATDVLEQMEARGGTQPAVKYQLAVFYAMMDDSEAAFDWLEQAVGAGFSNAQRLESDTSFAALRSNDRFARVVAQIDKNARPCAFSGPHRQFDFWVGEWDVYNPQEQLVGTNSIRETENGCLLVEHWTGGSGGTGTSINYYDPGKARWVQQWVAAAGYLVQIEGGLNEAGAMVLEGELVSLNGARTPFRGTWTPLSDGRVRQFFEQSTDGRATWTPWFDGYYVRRDEGQ